MLIYPHKGQYRPGEVVILSCEPPQGTALVEVTIWAIHLQVIRIKVEPGATITWTAPTDQVWVAYGVECTAYDESDRLIAAGSTSFDVADHWYRSPRLGFMTDFHAGETLTETHRRVLVLTRLHINCLHFYDWFYTHHQYIPPEENFVDPMGRELSLINVRRKIRLAQLAGMAALASAPVYAAEEDFVKLHPDWALYRSDGTAFNVARLFYIMDFRPGLPWTRHILNQYAQAVSELGFDGIQIDQYGYPKRALPFPGALGQVGIDLSDHFLPFIEQAKNVVQQVRPDTEVIFHTCNNWPLRKVAHGPQVVNYIHVFSPHDSYRDLRDMIHAARALAPGKPVILAAYLMPFASDAPERAEVALRMLTAVVHASGGYHMILGEGEGVLTEGYFPNHARLSPAGLAGLQPYYDFLVRYGPLLHAPPEADVSETHGGGVTAVYAFTGAPVSPLPNPGTVWMVIREHDHMITINLVNLTGTTTGAWNEGQSPPPLVRGLSGICRVLEPIVGVYLASPEECGGRLQPIPFSVETDPHSGHLLRFSVLDLSYWSLILIVRQTQVRPSPEAQHGASAGQS